jgi:hypothetical protein
MLAILKSVRFWKRALLFSALFILLAIGGLSYLLSQKQNALVQELVKNANKDFQGTLLIGGSHISLFHSFPYVSIDLEKVRVYEDKTMQGTPIIDIQDVYLGFNIWSVVSGKMEIKKIMLEHGKFNVIEHADGSYNITKALSSETPVENPEEEFHLDLQAIVLRDLDINKWRDSGKTKMDIYIDKANASFKSVNDLLNIGLSSKFQLNLILDGDTTFLKHKHLAVKTDLAYDKALGRLSIAPTTIELEESDFDISGSVDFVKDVALDLKIYGNKPNFNLIFALAPEELWPVLKRYENKGQIYFETTLKGKSANGYSPAIEARFGCKDAYFNNFEVNKKVEDLSFSGYFTNGEKRDASTMMLHIRDFTARPEAGTFSGDLKVVNFTAPDISLKLKSAFELDFLAKFFNLSSLKELKGRVELTSNFHDIINLDKPEQTIERFEESYFTQLKIEDLSFASTAYGVPIKDLDLYAEMKGHKAVIEYLNVKAGKSDVAIKGSISDLPALIHHTAIPVTTDLHIRSAYLDLFELTGSKKDTSFDEQISDFSMDLEFISSAKNMTEFKDLPLGTFVIQNLNAKLKHYPHHLHDFHSDIIIRENDFEIIDFKGMVDQSDFLFSGKLHNYALWFEEKPQGDTKVDFNLVSNQLRFDNLFSYKGENYVPEDYRHEVLNGLKAHGFVDLHFKDSLYSFDMVMDKFQSKLKVHPLKMEQFKGRVHYENEHLVIEKFSGLMGHSDFVFSLHYYLGKDPSIRKRDNHFELAAKRLDLDELMNYTPQATSTNKEKVDHDAGFNIYTLPFSDMTFKVDIGRLNYHKIALDDIHTQLRINPQHYIYLDALALKAAGGNITGTGYFNGSNPEKIYVSPNLKMDKVDLDKLMLKFDNFGQDHLVSENLHGQFTGLITGKIHVHNDLIPILDDSEIHVDAQIVGGRIENYTFLEYLSDYFVDKNLKKVIFDSLTNHIDVTNGTVNIPKMMIQSSLGFMEISGKQDMDMNMEYYIRIPWSMVSQAAASKLFGRKKEEVDPEQIDEIQYADESKKIAYLNIKIIGHIDDYKITLGKDKKK